MWQPLVMQAGVLDFDHVLHTLIHVPLSFEDVRYYKALSKSLLDKARVSMLFVSFYLNKRYYNIHL